jgi:hypothetical protein
VNGIQNIKRGERQRTTTGRPPARHVLQSKRSQEIGDINRKSHCLNLEVNRGKNDRERSRRKLRGADLNRTGAPLLTPTGPIRSWSRSVILALRRTTAMSLRRWRHFRHNGRNTAHMETSDATLTERKLRHHHGEQKDHTDQRGQEGVDSWWISAKNLHLKNFRANVGPVKTCYLGVAAALIGAVMKTREMERLKSGSQH